MTPLPDPQWIVAEDEPPGSRTSTTGIPLEREQVMDRFEESIESILSSRVVVAAYEDDSPAEQSFADGFRDSGTGTLDVSDEIAEVQEDVIDSHHLVDLLDQSIIHGLHVVERPPESTADTRLAEVGVGGHEDATVQVQERPSGRRLKFTVPSAVTATMSSTRIPPIAREYSPGSTVRTSPSTS